MVIPLLSKLLDCHFKLKATDDQYITDFKCTIIFEVKERFKFERNETSSVSVRKIASFLDPRYKDLEFKPNFMREKICMTVKNLLERFDVQEIHLEQIPPVQSSDFEYSYGNTIIADDNLTNLLQIYIAEPPLRSI